MNCKIVVTENFRKEAKRLVKKFNSLKEDLRKLESSFEINPYQGISIGSNCFKIRLSIKSKSKGKRAGARVISFITEVVEDKNKTVEIYLISIYDKSELDNISDSKIKLILKEIRSDQK